MYRCDICDATTGLRQSMCRLVRYKPGLPRQIASETKVCRACARQIEMGLTVEQIKESIKPLPAAEAPTVTVLRKPRAAF